MPIIKYDRKNIEIEVADRIVGDTIVKQKAKFVKLTHEVLSNSSVATILVLVTLYSAKDNDYGTELTGDGFSNYTKTLTADNNTIVDASTGAIVAIRKDENNELWKAKADLAEQPVMFQADFFEMLRDTQSINITDMIKQHIMQANAMGKFN